MKRIILLILCGLGMMALSPDASAQKVKNLKKKYLVRSSEDGSVYFIFPQKGFKSKKMSSELPYDLTYASMTDSVTFNCTYISGEPTPIDSAVFVNGDSIHLSIPATMFFVEPYDDKKWENRASLKILSAEFQELYKEEKPYKLFFYSKGEEYLFEVKDKDWKEHSALVNKVFEIIKHNIRD